jgi:hypothetical protein
LRNHQAKYAVKPLFFLSLSFHKVDHEFTEI